MGAGASLTLLALYLRAGSMAMTQRLLDAESYAPPWLASAPQGRKIIKRHFEFYGYKVEMAGHIQWRIPRVGADWHRSFFSFSWLHDLATINSDKIASSFAREFINGFTLIGPQDDVHECAWEREVVGERLHYWLCYRQFVLRGGSRTFFARYQRALITHVRALYQHAELEPEALGPAAIKGLIAAAIALPGLGFILRQAPDWIDALITRDVLPDGGHISQSPGFHLAFLKHVIEMRDMLALAHVSAPALNEAIPRMGAVLESLMHGDGRLALFKHNLMEERELIAAVLDHAGTGETPLLYAPDMGYARLQNGQSYVFMRMLPSQETVPPLGLGGIEFSEGATRIIVNCGSYAGPSPQWHEALHQPSAYSGLELDPPATPALLDEGQQDVEETVTRQYARLQYAIESNLAHERYVELSQDGQLVRGSDRLQFINPPGNATLPGAIVRFHLHPDIRCQSHSDGSVSLTCVHGAVWQFSCNLTERQRTEESVFLGYRGKPQKTQQLVIHCPLHEKGISLRWELKKLA